MQGFTGLLRPSCRSSIWSFSELSLEVPTRTYPSISEASTLPCNPVRSWVSGSCAISPGRKFGAASLLAPPTNSDEVWRWLVSSYYMIIPLNPGPLTTMQGSQLSRIRKPSPPSPLLLAWVRAAPTPAPGGHILRVSAKRKVSKKHCSDGCNAGNVTMPHPTLNCSSLPKP